MYGWDKGGNRRDPFAVSVYSHVRSNVVAQLQCAVGAPPALAASGVTIRAKCWIALLGGALDLCQDIVAICVQERVQVEVLNNLANGESILQSLFKGNSIRVH